MKNILCALILLFGALAAVYGQSGDEKTVKKLLELTEVISVASKNNDRAALERLLVAEFFMTLPDGRTFDRKWTIDFWTKADDKITNESFEIADARVVVSADTAIVTAIVTDRWRENGIEKIHRERIFDVWRRYKRKWRLLASKPNKIEEKKGT